MNFSTPLHGHKATISLRYIINYNCKFSVFLASSSFFVVNKGQTVHNVYPTQLVSFLIPTACFPRYDNWKGFYLNGYDEVAWNEFLAYENGDNPRGKTCEQKINGTLGGVVQEGAQRSMNQFWVPSTHAVEKSKLSCTMFAQEEIYTGNNLRSGKRQARVHYECQGERDFSVFTGDLSNKYWFFVLQCCDCQQMTVYAINSWTNGIGNMDKEFSADEKWVVYIIIAELSILVAVTFFQLHSDGQFKGMIMSRQVFKLALALSIISRSCYLQYYLRFSKYGHHTTGVAKNAGDIFWALHEITMTGLLMMLAKGWTIYRPIIRKSSQYKIGAYLLVYMITFIVLLKVEQRDFNPEYVTWRWDSTPGKVLCAVYFSAGAIFVWYIHKTVENAGRDDEAVNSAADQMICPQDKLAFFKVFGTFYFLWLICFPLSIFILMAKAPAFTRENSAWLVNAIRESLGIVVLAALWMPHEDWNSWFPFETSVLSIGAGGTGDDVNRSMIDPTNFDDPTDKSNAVEARRSIFAAHSAADDYDGPGYSSSQDAATREGKARDPVISLARRTLRESSGGGGGGGGGKTGGSVAQGTLRESSGGGGLGNGLTLESPDANSRGRSLDPLASSLAAKRDESRQKLPPIGV